MQYIYAIILDNRWKERDNFDNILQKCFIDLVDWNPKDISNKDKADIGQN